MSAAEEEFALQVRVAGLPEPRREYRFCERRWRFDFAWPPILEPGKDGSTFLRMRPVAVEIEGARWRRVRGVSVSMSRHSSPSGLEADIRKYNTATKMGWRVVRFTAAMIRSGEALEAVADLLGCPLKAPRKPPEPRTPPARGKRRGEAGARLRGKQAT